MSMFTQQNGPQLPPCGPTVNQQITELINQYTSLSAKVDQHIAKSIVNNVHEATETLTSITGSINNIAIQLSALIANVGQLSSLSTADKTNIVAAINSLVTSINNKADTSTLSSAVTQLQNADTQLNNRIEQETTNRQQAVLSVSTALDNLGRTVSNFIATFTDTTEDEIVTRLFDGILTATVAIKGKIKAEEIIDFTKWSKFKATYTGTGSSIDTGTNGLYILGMLSEDWEEQELTHEFKPKAARAYLKYVDDEPFDAIVDITATSMTNGQMIATVSKDENHWKGMVLCLVSGTDSGGISHVYLGISATDITGLAEYEFYVAGVNFIPKGATDYTAPNGTINTGLSVLHIADKGGTSISNIAIDDLNYMTPAEATAIWDQYHQ